MTRKREVLFCWNTRHTKLSRLFPMDGTLQDSESVSRSIRSDPDPSTFPPFQHALVSPSGQPPIAISQIRPAFCNLFFFLKDPPPPGSSSLPHLGPFLI